MRSGFQLHDLLAVSVLIIFVAGTGAQPLLSSDAPTNTGLSLQAYPNASWAVGLVVPQGASLEGGTRVSWESVGNVTAAVTLPDISRPDAIVYVVVSIMTSKGSVLQAAAGIRPNESDWFAYAWSIPSIRSVPPTYQWMLNGSGAPMAPGANVSISIYQASGAWDLKVAEGALAGTTTSFPADVGASLKAGDQEVFAFESYSRLAATFQNMGNLTLNGLFLDGLMVSKGGYIHSDWDPSHTPLFAVGSSGASPPSFVSIVRTEDGAYVWGYSTVWTNPAGVPLAIIVIATLVLAVALVVGFILWKARMMPRGALDPNG